MSGDQDEQIRILNAGQGGSLVDRLTQAEGELTALDAEAKAAYRHYADLDRQRDHKAAEVKELRLRIREEASL